MPSLVVIVGMSFSVVGILNFPTQHRQSFRNATSFGITCSGASSISQWPEPYDHDALDIVVRPGAPARSGIASPAFSPVSTSIGIVSLVLAKPAKSLASCSKARNTSKPARMAPGCA